MKKNTTISTTLNGRPVQLTVELELTEADLAPLWERKKVEYLESITPARNTFEYNVPSNGYTPYSSGTSTQSEAPAEDQQFDETSSSYTPYASTLRNSTPDGNFPKSYVAKINETYAPYSTFRVNMPKGWEPNSN